MIRDFYNEVWKAVSFFENILPGQSYRVSNYGRLTRIKDGKEKLFKPYNMHGYFYFKVKEVTPRKFKTIYVHKLVAQCFLEQGGCEFVLHLDYDKQNNELSNLKWATRREKEIHQYKNPIYKTRPTPRKGAKLTENDVRRLKKILNNPDRKTRLRIIAKQFGVTTTQLKRIKTGENWADVPAL
jgi:hypothetical protein